MLVYVCIYMETSNEFTPMPIRKHWQGSCLFVSIWKHWSILCLCPYANMDRIHACLCLCLCLCLYANIGRICAYLYTQTLSEFIPEFISKHLLILCLFYKNPAGSFPFVRRRLLPLFRWYSLYSLRSTDTALFLYVWNGRGSAIFSKLDSFNHSLV